MSEQVTISREFADAMLTLYHAVRRSTGTGVATVTVDEAGIRVHVPPPFDARLRLMEVTAVGSGYLTCRVRDGVSEVQGAKHLVATQGDRSVGDLIYVAASLRTGVFVDGAEVTLVDVAGGGGAPPLRIRVASVHAQHLTGYLLTDTQGDDLVKVALPPELQGRSFVNLTRDGVTYSGVSDQTRTVTYDGVGTSERIWPAYYVHDGDPTSVDYTNNSGEVIAAGTVVSVSPGNPADYLAIVDEDIEDGETGTATVIEDSIIYATQDVVTDLTVNGEAVTLMDDNRAGRTWRPVGTDQYQVLQMDGGLNAVYDWVRAH